jgi:hypothetical protein
MNPSMNFGTQPLAQVGNHPVWNPKWASLGDDAVLFPQSRDGFSLPQLLAQQRWGYRPIAKASGGRIAGGNWGA